MLRGVAGDVRHWGAHVVIEPAAYYPYAHVPDNMRSLIEANMGILVRSRLSPTDLPHPISTAIAGVNSDLRLPGGFSFLALTLAALGVYAVMAYSVSRRTREIGIRIALGASSREVLRLIVQQGARLEIIGSITGVAGAFLLRRIMASFLYGLSAKDPLALCLVVIVLAC